MRLKLFICHVSVDKPDFVRELATALKTDFDVWIDEEKVSMGDSLFQKINSGLAECDYAVVVISPPFLDKKWPMAELGALFALEEKNQKLILPIWKDIERETIRRECPMLLDRFAALASDGIPNIVDQIRQAVLTSERMRQITPIKNLAVEFKAFISSIESRNEADTLLFSRGGARLVRQEFSRIETVLKEKLAAIESETGAYKFDVLRSLPCDEIYITFLSVRLNICLDGVAVNSAHLARLHCEFYKMGQLREFGQRDDPTSLEKRELFPYIRNKNDVVWQQKRSSEESIPTEQLIIGLIKGFLEHLRRLDQRRH